MRILAAAPLRTGSVVWQEQAGQFTLTLACKATFALAPLLSPLAPEPEDVTERDNHWDDDPQRSVYAPSDLAPLKPEPEVLLVGSAFAPQAQPVRSLFARLIVGQVDKSVEVFCPRFFLADGSLRDGPRWTQMPLRYERAAGGPDSWNPVGIGADAIDRSGRRALPNLQPPGLTVDEPGFVVPPVGLGPIAPAWPGRREKLRDRAARWSDERWADEPLGEGFDASFFQASPRDQRLEALRADEQIVLENLHPEHPRLVTRLPGVRPRARVEAAGSPAWDLTLVADTLWIDTARALCTVTWRGQVPLDDRDQRGVIRVGLDEPGKGVRWPSDASPAPRVPGGAPPAPEPRAPSTPDAEPGDDPDFGDTATEEPHRKDARVSRPVLPFQHGAAPPIPPPPVRRLPPPHPGDDPTATVHAIGADPRGAMPSWLGRAAGGASAAFAPPPEAHRPPPPPPPPVPAMLRPPSEPYLGSPPVPGVRVPPPPPPSFPARLGFDGPAPLGSQPVAGLRAPASRDETAEIPRAEPAAAYGGLLEASNAAADPHHAAPARKGTLRGEHAPPPPRAMVELIWHDPAKLARVRAVAAWAPWMREKIADAPADDAEAQKKVADERAKAERADVVAVLGRGAPTYDVEGAVLDAAAEDGGLDPPLLLVAGELELGLDEVKMLEAMIGAAGSLAAGDKKLKEVTDLAAELMRTPLGASPGVAAGLLVRVREAWSKANRLLPADYLDVHTRRLLLEQRSYQKRELWNDSYLRAVLSPAGDGAGIPAYLPASLAKQLPLFSRFPARLLAEAFPQQDQAESHPVALRVAALGRTVTPRARR